MQIYSPDVEIDDNNVSESHHRLIHPHNCHHRQQQQQKHKQTRTQSSKLFNKHDHEEGKHNDD